MSQLNIAIFASGNGSNAEKFFEHFRNHDSIKISCLLSNNADAFALTRAENNQVPTFTFNRQEFRETETVLHYLQDKGVTHIVLAGFMWLVPQYLIQAYPNRIVNIHPALLPKYGGKGMYGDHVHNAVIENKEDESGITIHYVNEIYDDGKIIFQGRCKVLPNDDSDTLAQRIHQLEYEYYPKVVEAVVLNEKIPSQ
jgi:phosphoribosylglycinamide formyltransferase-1